MAKLNIQHVPGSTPLDLDEFDALIPKYVATQGELNRLEQANILDAQLWLHKQKHRDVLVQTFITTLHKKMLGKVWKWAGTFRGSNKNIGVDKSQIQEELAKLLHDVKYWTSRNTYSIDEIGTRLHHRLVWTHLFANGNGRHARLLTDAWLRSQNTAPFTWGLHSSNETLDEQSNTRQRYIQALKAADKHDLNPLLSFVRS